MKTVTIVVPCYNEEQNVADLHERIKEAVLGYAKEISFTVLFIDNASTDSTAKALRRLASDDSSVQVILNQRNFGHIRSPFYALLQTKADAVILMAADFQDPPQLLPLFIEEWKKGHLAVQGIKTESEESAAMYAIRSAYYRFINRLSTIELTQNTTGFGIYDRKVIDALRLVDDPYPYFRGLVSELGFAPKLIPFKQPSRKRGISSNNFYSLYDIAMLGITSHSKVPLRVATLLGFCMSGLSLLVALAYLVAKLIWWDQFVLGTAPIVIGIFFTTFVQLFFLGIIGEYIGFIHTHVVKRPLVIEKERINF